MLDDTHKEKIDMADEIFVINPGGYIGDSTCSDICYAKMTDKKIEALTPIPESYMDEVVSEHICKVEEYARRQHPGYRGTKTRP